MCWRENEDSDSINDSGIVSLWGGSLSDFEQKEVQQKQTEIKYMFNDPGTS